MAKKLLLFANKFLFLLLLLNFGNVRTSKINAPHVLLPIFQDVDVTFELEAVNGGCYKWTTTRLDVIKLTLVDPTALECSTKAIVTCITKEPVRNVAVVIAEDVDTQLTLRVDVTVDVIDKLAIISTTKEIILAEIPEMFRVVAYDNKGNQFTTLQGVEFEWNVISLGSNKDADILNFMAFKDSPYDTPDSIEAFEYQDKKGDVVLLEGVKTGSSKLSVKLPYDEYEYLAEAEVVLAVIENLLILPSDAFIIPYDIITFKLFSINNGQMEEVSLADSPYFLEIADPGIASVDPKTGEVTGLEPGQTKVLLRDSMADEDDQQKLPSATLHVNLPAYITLSMLPHKNWAIVVNDPHVILAEIYASNDRKFDIGPGVELQVQLDEKFFLLERTANGTMLTGWGQQPGKASVSVTLDGVTNDVLGHRDLAPISAKQDIKIFPSIIVKPSDVILPWDPVSQPRYEIQLSVVGGDGRFSWMCTNQSIGIVTQTGLVKTHSDGVFEVYAVMVLNPNNKDVSKFAIVPPTRLEIVEYITEAEIDSNIYVHIAIYGDKPDSGKDSIQIPFTQCQDLPFKIQTSDPHFVIKENETMDTIGVSCANVAVSSSIVGSTRVTVTYNIGGKNLGDSITISTYKPLVLVFPETPIVLAVGTSIQLIFTGGPMNTPGKELQYIKVVTNENEDVIDAADVTDAMTLPSTDEGYTVVNVLCKMLGESQVTLAINTAPTLASTRHTNCSMTVPVVCGKPRSITIQPDIEVDSASSCPMDLSADRALAQSDADTELDVAVYDENGLRFLNISTLLFEWEVDPPLLATLGSKDSIFPRDILNGSLNFGNKSYQVVTPKTNTGTITVKTTIVGYDKKKLILLKITPEWPEFLDESEQGTELPPITTTVTLVLVDNTQVIPNDVTLYNHPASKENVEVAHGSGYYEMVLSRPDIADVVYSSHRRLVEITPRNDGELTIELTDLCLAGKPVTISVHVVSVSMLRVEMSDKVEVNKCITCFVKLYDESDNLLNVPSISMIGIQVDQDPEVASFNRQTPDDSDPWPPGHIKYIVQGDKIGDSQIKFSISTSVVPIESAPLELQVFGPLRIQPRNLTTIIGTNVQFMHEGGPVVSPTMEYSLADQKIGEISPEGILNALKLGSTKVTGKCVGINPANGQKVVYASDTAEVHIIKIQGFQIKAPLTRLRVKTEVPVWVNGIPEEITPMILGTAKSDFIYEWFVEDTDIIKVVDVFDPIGVTYDPTDRISIRVRGLRPGKTKLTLNVTVPGVVVQSKKKMETFSDSLTIEVFEGLSLMSPAGFSGRALLMAPNSTLQLMTNIDSHSRITYKLAGDNQTALTVTSQGVVKSESQLGYGTIIVTSMDQHGLKQTLNLIVEVKPIYYMKLDIISEWIMETSEFNNIIPLGTEFQLRASFHDNTGNEFSAGTAKIIVKATRFDLTTIQLGPDNVTLHSAMMKPGITILQILADGIQKGTDYIKLHVGQAVVPRVTSLVIGDIVCMWTPVNSATPGVWSSSDPTLFAIDSETGIGMAVPSRGGKVSLTHSLHPVAPIQLDVVPINNIVCEPIDKPIITNSVNNRPLEIPVLILGEGTNRKNNLLHAVPCEIDAGETIKEYPIDCEIEFSNRSVEIEISKIFQVQTTFNTKTGMYQCVIGPTGLTDPATSTLDTSITLTVRSRGSNVVSDPLQIEFLPAMYLEKELALDDNHFSAELVVVGNEKILGKVMVTPFDPNLLEVSKPERVDENTLKYKVKLIDYHWKLSEYEGPLLVKVFSGLTEENVKVNVKVLSPGKFGGPDMASKGLQLARSPLVSFLFRHRHILIIVISMLIIFIGTFYVYSQFVQPVIHVNVTPVRSLLSPTSQAQRTTPTSPRALPGTSHVCPCHMPNCPNTSHSPNMSPNTSVTPTKQSVYGDPTSFYSTSPEMRRNRRFM